MRELDEDAIISLFRAEIKRAGGVVAWSRTHRIHRTTISNVLAGRQAPTKGIIKALGLRIIVVSGSREKKPPNQTPS